MPKKITLTHAKTGHKTVIRSCNSCLTRFSHTHGKSAACPTCKATH